MGKKCKKCGYERRDADTAPDYECPQCGAVYAKVEARIKAGARPPTDANAKSAAKPFSLGAEVPMKEIIGITAISLVMLFFLLRPAHKDDQGQDALCRLDLQCWGDKHRSAASVRCDDKIERFAKYSHQWTKGTFESIFSHLRWRDKEAGTITYQGDKIQFQNGLGAWQTYTYVCDYDPATETVINVGVTAGRI